MPHRVWQAMTWIQMAEWEFPDDLRIAIATPLSHAAMSLVAPVLLSGGAFYVMESFDPGGFFDLVAEHRITATLIVPVMLYALQGHPRYDTADMSSMETIFYGASPMSPAKLAQAIEDWGPIFFQFYGQTEAPMVITHLKKAEHDLGHFDRLSSCGRPVPWMHVGLLDRDNRPVARGESGRLRLSPGAMRSGARAAYPAAAAGPCEPNEGRPRASTGECRSRSPGSPCLQPRGASAVSSSSCSTVSAGASSTGAAIRAPTSPKEPVI